jgi:hypothetical protein
MSDPPDPDEHDPVVDEPVESPALRALLKRSLSGDAPGTRAPDLLPGVQKRIRRRSKGKFFSDGWSTTHTRMSYLLVAVCTLLLVALALLALGPMDVRP